MWDVLKNVTHINFTETLPQLRTVTPRKFLSEKIISITLAKVSIWEKLFRFFLRKMITAVIKNNVDRFADFICGNIVPLYFLNVSESTMFVQMFTFLKNVYRPNNAASGKVIVRSIVFWLCWKNGNVLLIGVEHLVLYWQTCQGFWFSRQWTS